MQSDDLFALPLDEFTAARNQLAKELKQAGDREAAEQVRGLAKPTVPAWTVNQLVRKHKAAVQALLNAGEALRKAQERALGDQGAAAGLREAQATERKALQELTRRAREVLTDAGRPASSSVLDRVTGTLSAGALTEQGRTLLAAGRLTEELEPVGFEALAGLAPAKRPAPGKRDDLAARRREREEARRRKRELVERVRALERAAEQAERAAVEARKAADDAAAELDSL